MSLRITLRDGERIVLNGAELRSVVRTELRVEARPRCCEGERS